jgi:hypothetical protein
LVADDGPQRRRLRLPEGYDPARHSERLHLYVKEHLGPSWVVEMVDLAGGCAYARRRVEVTELEATDGSERMEVRLASGSKPGDAEKIAARLEDQHPGWTMTAFDPWLGRAELAKIPESHRRARAAVATALGAKPWEVGVEARQGGGYLLRLPATYLPSRHDARLDEVAKSVIGGPGWYVEVDPPHLRAEVIPGDPPSFPPVLEYPFASEPDPMRLPVGRRLGRSGTELGPEVVVDLQANPHVLVSGTTGSGKSVVLWALVGGALRAGWQVAIADGPKGGVDFVAFRDACSGWGDSLERAAEVAKSVYEEGQRRKALLKGSGARRWHDLPPGDRPPPLMLVVDELTSLIIAEPVPKGVPRGHSLVEEASERNLAKAEILSTLGKIARELRFVGVSLVGATQKASTATGIPTELRENMSAHILLGLRPSEGQRKLALSNPELVPEVPAHLADDVAASRGVGVYELDGVPPGVLKVYWAAPEEYMAHAASSPTGSRLPRRQGGRLDGTPRSCHLALVQGPQRASPQAHQGGDARP